MARRLGTPGDEQPAESHTTWTIRGMSTQTTWLLLSCHRIEEWWAAQWVCVHWVTAYYCRFGLVDGHGRHRVEHQLPCPMILRVAVGQGNFQRGGRGRNGGRRQNGGSGRNYFVHCMASVGPWRLSLGLILYFKLDQCGPHGLREKCPPWTGMNQRDPAGNQCEPCWIVLDSACPAWFSVE